MNQSLSCALCGAVLTEASSKTCPACGGRVVPEFKASLEDPSPESRSRVGDYFLECRLGSGGMGEVYLAKQISMKREVALKILQRELSSDKKYLERFFREVRLLAQLEHPNIVHAIEAGMEGDTCYFSMEYVHGKDLKRQIDLGRHFNEQETLQMACQVAAALSYAWEKRKLIHRDVKPANIILTADCEVKLMDLGISKRQFESSEITLDGMMVGSPTYISPEQARSEKDLDFRADMYSLGASLFHILTGKPPYDADSPVAVVTMHLGSPVPDPRDLRPDISKATASLIMRMMEKERENRFESWDDAIAQMQSIIERRKTAVIRKRDGSPEATKPSLVPLPARVKKFISWHPSAVFKVQPKNRMIILGCLLTAAVISFSMVVARSIKDANVAEERKILKAAIVAAESCNPEDRPAVIGRLEEIARNAPPEMAKAAVGSIERIRSRIIAEQESEDAEHAKKLLNDAKKKSAELEMAGNFSAALRLWRNFKNIPEVKGSSQLSNAADGYIEALTQGKKQKEAGLE